MKKENFKLGDTVFFMQSNKPCSGEIMAILVIEGKMKVDYHQYDTKGEKETIYYAGFSTFKESEIFSTMEELKESLFSVTE